MQMDKNAFIMVKLAKGEMNVYDFGGVTLHAYKTNDLIMTGSHKDVCITHGRGVL